MSPKLGTLSGSGTGKSVMDVIDGEDVKEKWSTIKVMIFYHLVSLRTVQTGAV